MEYTKSIVTEDMNHCFVCGSSHVVIHHVFGAANRKHSTKYGLVVPLCPYHHNESAQAVHFNKEFMDMLHECGQIAFEKAYPKLDFIKIFGRNYKQ